MGNNGIMLKIRLGFIVIFAFLSIACFSQQEDLGSIYSSCINKRLQDFRRPKTFIMDSTSKDELDFLRQTIKQGVRIKKLDSSWLKTYQNLDTTNTDVSQYFKNSKNIVPLSGKRKEIILDTPGENYWDVIHKKYPAYTGLVFVSPAYFNNNHTQGLFSFSLIYSNCSNGARQLCQLKKNSFGNWVFIWYS